MGHWLGLESRLASPQLPTVLSPALATSVPPHLSTGRERLGLIPDMLLVIVLSDQDPCSKIMNKEVHPFKNFSLLHTVFQC